MTMPQDPAPQSATLAEKVAFLSALPGVEEVIETHMAFVFLTHDQALKLKKPLMVGHSDCRTFANREKAVAKEIWLNKILAPGVYLGRLPLCQGEKGLSIRGDGTVIDWLVQMKRLPRRWMLDDMIRHRRLPDPAQIDALTTVLVAFYRRQTARRPPRHLHALHLEREAAVNDAHLRDLAAHLPNPENLRVLDVVNRSLRALHPEILARDRSGMVVEGHGDLRPEHVCFTDPPVIFDRAEAALELRAVDVWDECMFLAAESAMLGYSALGGKLADALLAAGFQPPSPRLLIAYIQLRLVTRARLALDHLRDTPPPKRENWPRKAQRYLDAAAALCDVDGVPALRDLSNPYRPAGRRLAEGAAEYRG
jgi:aminoglycoside phosphotransferase family enzyme